MVRTPHQAPEPLVEATELSPEEEPEAGHTPEPEEALASPPIPEPESPAESIELAAPEEAETPLPAPEEEELSAPPEEAVSEEVTPDEPEPIPPSAEPVQLTLDVIAPVEEEVQEVQEEPESLPEVEEPPAEEEPQPLTWPSFLANRPIKPKAPPPPPKPESIPPEDRAPEIESSLESTPTVERYRPPASQTSPPAEHHSIRIAPLINREKKRSIGCFECQHEHEILADSSSALCPKCGAYIGLKNYDIRDQRNSRIQTRGNVFIHKKGEVTGITIQCHNLTIEGEIKGGAECSGDFIIRKTGKINGPVTSDRVIIERRATVDFISGVTAREVIIDGEVTGAVSCKKLTLKKRATLDGDLTVGSLSIEEGARHTGNIRMTGA